MFSSVFHSVPTTRGWVSGSGGIPPQKLSESVIRQKLVNEGKLGETQSLEEYFSNIPEGEVIRDLRQSILRHLQDQVQMEIQEREREIAELRKERK
jgi:hypothetical protein